MYAIKAVYDGKGFTPKQQIPVTENYEVVITFIKPVDKGMAANEPIKLPLSTARGLLRGKVWMADDFDAPLEEFKEYM